MSFRLRHRSRAVKPWRFSAREFWTMAGHGDFADCNAELLNGRIYEAALATDYEGGTRMVAYHALRAMFGPGYRVRVKGTLNLSKFTVLDPDLSVVPGDENRPEDAIPVTAGLVVEIAAATLDFDRTKKGRAYAKAGIADYWILNLRERVLEVYRDPGAVIRSDGKPTLGFGSRIVFDETHSVSPLYRPDLAVAVANLFAHAPTRRPE